MKSKDPDAILHVSLLLLFAALMGGLFPLTKIAEQAITPLSLAMVRAVMAAIFLVFIVGVGMRRDLTPLISQWKAYTTLGVLLSVFFASIPEAEERISANLSSLLTCIIPISTFLIVTLVLRWERFTLLRFGGGIVALAGVAMFIGLEKIQFGHSELIGLAVISGGYIIYAIYLIYARSCEFDPFVATTGTMVYVALILGVAAFTLEQPLELLPGKAAMLAAFTIGVLSTGVAYAVLNYLITHAGVIFAATAGYFIPVFAILIDYFLVGESVAWIQLAGLGMTLVGARMVNHSPAIQPASPPH